MEESIMKLDMPIKQIYKVFCGSEAQATVRSIYENIMKFNHTKDLDFDDVESFLERYHQDGANALFLVEFQK